MKKNDSEENNQKQTRRTLESFGSEIVSGFLRTTLSEEQIRNILESVLKWKRFLEEFEEPCE